MKDNKFVANLRSGNHNNKLLVKLVNKRQYYHLSMIKLKLYLIF